MNIKQRISLNCDFCNKKLFRLECQIKKHNYCCRKCRYLHQKVLNKGENNPIRKHMLEHPDFMKGENNPNFNKKWSNLKRTRQSKIMKEIYDKNPKLKENVSKFHKGKKRSLEEIQKQKDTVKRLDVFKGRKISLEAKQKISVASKKRFSDPEFKAKYRKRMEELGAWVPLKDKKDIEIYFKQANWIGRMFDFANDNDLELLKKHKVYNSKNSKGIVRDHIFSRNSGFLNKVFPEILRHPCNCAIILHSDNIKKRGVDFMTLEQLFKKIINFTKKWLEQKRCLELIEKYKQGERWQRDYVTYTK